MTPRISSFLCCAYWVASLMACHYLRADISANIALTTGINVIPDGRIVSGDFIVGAPLEIERLFTGAAEAYDAGGMSNAAHYSSEAVKRYEASHIIAADKIGFMTIPLKRQMSYLYRIYAETLFASNETEKAMAAITTALNLDADNITNHIVSMCIATALDDYPTQNLKHGTLGEGTYSTKLAFYNELLKKGWFLPIDLTDAEFSHFETILGITNRLERPVYYVNKDNGHTMVHRWKGLDQSQDFDFTQHKIYAQKTVKINRLMENLSKARREGSITGVLDIASSILSEYGQLLNDYTQERPSLRTVPESCHFLMAQAYMAKGEHMAAMQHVLCAEKQAARPSFWYDFIKTIILILDENPEEATRLAIKYKRARSDKKRRDAYFALLIEAGYISDNRWFSDEGGDIRRDYDLDCEIRYPPLLQASIPLGHHNVGNGNMVQQWTGLNSMRYEPVGPMRMNSWNTKAKSSNTPGRVDFCLDTLEVSCPSSNEVDVVLVVTPKYEQAFSYIWNDSSKEVGWYNFDTQERATNVFVRDENIFWFSNPSAKLTRFSLRGAIEIKEVQSFPRNLMTYKVANSEQQRTRKWKQQRFGDNRLDVRWIKKELNLLPDEAQVPPYYLSVSNTVIVVSTNGRPSIAQLRYVDTFKREAKWYSPFSTEPSPIRFGDIVAFSANIPEPNWVDKLTQTTQSRGMELYWQKILQILGVTKEQFNEEPFVYGTAAIILLLVILSVNRLFASVWEKGCVLLRKVLRHFWKFASLAFQPSRVHSSPDTQRKNTGKIRHTRIPQQVNKCAEKGSHLKPHTQPKKNRATRHRARQALREDDRVRDEQSE